MLVLAIAIGATVPFLNKAFHIDDVLYLRVAEQILKTPLDPYRGIVLWDARDGEPAALFNTDFNPPLWKYILAAAIRFFGRVEWRLHLVESLFVVGAAFAIFRVSRRLTRWPIWCVAMMVFSPFFLPGQNLMLEGPMLCFGLWGVEMLLQALEQDRIAKSFAAGALLSLALLVKYTAGLLLPILAFLVAIHAAFGPRTAGDLGRIRLLRHAVFLLPPIAALAAWVAHNQHFYGTSHFGAHGYLTGIGDAMTRFRAVVRTIGAVTVFGLPLAWLTMQSKLGTWRILASLTLAVGWSWFDWESVWATCNRQGWEPSTIEDIHFKLFAFHGAFILLAAAQLVLEAVVEALTSSNPKATTLCLTLATWCLAVFCFNIASVPFVAPRHLLLFFVPLVWIVGARWDSVDPNGRFRCATVACSTLLGFGLAMADAQVADHYRALAKTEIAPRVVGNDRTVWFTGTWGFTYYATQAGAYPIVSRPEEFGLPGFRAGDTIVHPALLSWGDLYGFKKKVPRCEEIEHNQIPTDSPLRTVGPNINYYAVQGHSLPWCTFMRLTDAWPHFELPPLDDVLVLQLVSGPATNP